MTNNKGTTQDVRLWNAGDEVYVHLLLRSITLLLMRSQVVPKWTDYSTSDDVTEQT
jgi:hypothetical protein